MLLTFTKPKFEGLIKENIKQHTIRADKNNRWKVGNTIQFWRGDPRNIHAKNKPYQFGSGVCLRIERIAIYPNENRIVIADFSVSNTVVLNDIAKNDGFENWEEMKTFFTEDFEGKLIFWNNCIWW